MEQIIKIVLAVIFGLAALAKFSGKTKDTFERVGYGIGFMYGIAVAEVIFTIGLFTRYDLLATISLLSIICGAVLTLIKQHAPAKNYAMALLSLVLLVVLSLELTGLL